MSSPRSDDDSRDLVPSGLPAEIVGPEALAHLLHQSSRDAAANRAQARELIKALEGVQRSHEYLGTALREEKRKSRWLAALLLLAPVAVAAGVWYVGRQVDRAQSDVEGRLARMAADAETARADDSARQQDRRVTELAADLATLRGDLDASREALSAERRHVADREAALAAAETKTDGARTEIGALEWEVKAAKAKAGAEQARAAQLENRIRELQGEIDARAKAPPPAPSVVAATPAAAPAAERPPGPRAAPADPAETERVRIALNALLADAGDTVRYEFASLGGVAGRTLTGVTLVGADDRGVVVRTIQAARAEISLDAASGGAVLRFFDGKLLVGRVEAPFFDGAYGLVVRADASKWRKSGLDCIR